MQSAVELAETESELYRLSKCAMMADPDRSETNVPVFRVYRGDHVDTFVLESRQALPAAVVEITKRYGEAVDACALSIEVYTSYNPHKAKPMGVEVLLDPEIMDGLLTVAATSQGDSAVKLFQYHMLDDGGIQFEEHKIPRERLGTMLYEMKGLWSHQQKGQAS